MATSAVSSTTGTTTSTSSTSSSSSLDTLANEDTFMQLLVAQMKNQDPLNPMDGTEYVSQLSQLTSTEQISKMATAMSTMSSVVDNLNTSVVTGQLSSMIGKTVEWETSSTVTGSDGTSTTEKVQHTGTAQSVSISDGTPSLIVKEGNSTTTVSVSSLTSISDAS
ncbi:flagellar hook assembly protein FlgD [Pectinatus haikarae]|uniref:Flagellar basal-body rod modification protein FlgD n=1 Tax=Pectinatus haikarae TaxID=349096 RepID=A0ABT9Y8B8_9FIRM|nr:flagellar hook capping FlgD N-terminal domain-containing protein [Pectinatus haikarae]MDQ0203776.1 flagellar basal-body rod modification protein FlgD [Pectinatus haikarae]